MDRTGSASSHRGGKGRDAFRTISEVAEHLDLPQHVLRFWESKFSQIKPLKRGGNRRYYRPDDVTLLSAIKKLLHSDGYTIRGVQKLFKAQGIKATIALALEDGAVADVASVVSGASADDQLEPTENPRSNETIAPSKSDLRPILERLQRLRSSLN